ncbi:ABC transporter ATP-binding protein [Mesorhizobium abyssinicae]|uniref:ABC transporter ATP-binding protein n=1 Tax=Mesorhizobium abyssinicae TaxID=1209958 RepID=UPI003391EBA7
MPNHETAADFVSVENLKLAFPNGYVGLKETSISIKAGQFCTLLGPSGSGKTTLLRAIAGLVAPTSGTVHIDGKNVTALPIQGRNIGFVFQNYALFPHMTVAENIDYPLKVHRWAPQLRASRVKEILELIELPELARRPVGELSGGQQQRVAIGRALVYRPSLLLLDEPMGALDRRLRQQLGTQLREIQQRTGITALYVTHDQEEAFILSDRIAIMNRGEILQFDEPTRLYHRPNSRFSAEFLGEANFIDATDASIVGSQTIVATELGNFPVVDDHDTKPTGASRTVLLRPESITLSITPEAPASHCPAVPVTLRKTLFLGSRCMVTVVSRMGKELLVECRQSEIPQTSGQLYASWPTASAVLVNR